MYIGGGVVWVYMHVLFRMFCSILSPVGLNVRIFDGWREKEGGREKEKKCRVRGPVDLCFDTKKVVMLCGLGENSFSFILIFHSCLFVCARNIAF